MASQPCRKCGIDVDPDIQDVCPNCGRKIAGGSEPVGWEPPDWEEPRTEWDSDAGAGDEYEAGTLPPLPPPPPPGAEPPSRPRRFTTNIGVRIALGLLIFGGYSAWNAFDSADRDERGAIINEGDVAAYELAVGDCLLDPGEETFEEVRGVACKDPHDFEIYHLATLPGGSYPTELQFDNAVIQQCLPAFEVYTGEAYDFSELWIGTFIPDRSAWSAGDHIMQCYLYLPNQTLIGSRAR